MSIKTRLRLNMAVLGIVCIFLLCTLTYSHHKFKETISLSKEIEKITSGASALSMLTLEMSIYPDEERPAKQWALVYDSTKEHIHHMLDINTKYHEDINLLGIYFDELGIYFNDLVSIKNTGIIATPKLKNLFTKMASDNQAFVSAANALQTKATNNYRDLKNVIFAFEIIAILAATVLIIIMSAILINRIVFSLGRIQSVADDVGYRNKLTSRINLEGSDELAKFSRVFDSMLEKIQMNIVEKDKLLERLNSKTIQLQQSNEDLKGFAYSVSHDLKAPLRHIFSYIALMLRKNENLDDKTMHYMNVVQSSANKMEGLIEDLLTFSKIGTAEIKKESLDLNMVLDEVLQQFEEEIEQRKVKLNIQKMPTVLADRFTMETVLLNLISNAIKYSSKEENPEISISYTELDNSVIKVSVRDNGVGFEMEYKDKLFGVFQRLHSNEEFEGNGIGLANVKKVLVRHGGEVDCESKLGEGAAFSFTVSKI